MLQTDIAVCGEHSHVPATLGLPLLTGVCAFPVYTAQAPGCSIWSEACVACGSSFRVLHNSADSVAPAFCAFPGLSGSGSQGLDGRTLPGCGAPFPLCGPSLSFCARRSVPAACVCSQELASSRDPPGGGCRPSKISGSLWIETGGLFAVWDGDAFSGAEFAPSPSPLPPTSGGDGPVRHRLALLWSFSVPLFCERPAVCSGWLIFSLAILQFKKAPSDCSQGLRAGPHPKQCRPLLSVSPPLAGGGCRRLGYFSAGSCF